MHLNVKGIARICEGKRLTKSPLIPPVEVASFIVCK